MDDAGEFAGALCEGHLGIKSPSGADSVSCGAWPPMSTMFNPPHTGLTLRDDILPALNLQVGEAASQLGVDRATLSKVLNARAAITPSMALRIERWLGRDNGGAAEVWLTQQSAYNLWRARQETNVSKSLSLIKTVKLQTA